MFRSTEYNYYLINFKYLITHYNHVHDYLINFKYPITDYNHVHDQSMLSIIIRPLRTAISTRLKDKIIRGRGFWFLSQIMYRCVGGEGGRTISVCIANSGLG